MRAVATCGRSRLRKRIRRQGQRELPAFGGPFCVHLKEVGLPLYGFQPAEVSTEAKACLTAVRAGGLCYGALRGG